MKMMFLRTDYVGGTKVGGSFSHVRGFLDGFRSLGNECFGISSSPVTFPGPMRWYDIPYPARFRNLPEVLSIAYNERLLPEARRIIGRERPDFMYHRHSEFNFVTGILRRETGIPLVLECNGSEVWVKKNWGRVYLESWLSRAEEVQFEAADVITVVSSALQRQLVDLGVPARKVVVNPNGVDTDAFRPGVDGSGIRAALDIPKAFVAGFVGTFGAWHGVDVLARSVKTAAALVPDVHFLVVGDGALRPVVEKILHDDGVADRVTLAGSVAHDDIPRYLSACDVLLSPHVQNNDGSEFFGSPTKLFEYMGMGKPIVASNVGQIGEVLHDGKNALIMEEKNHRHLAECIERLANSPSLRDRLGREARSDAEVKFSWRVNARRVVDAVRPFLQ